jgi:hypothetical protein
MPNTISSKTYRDKYRSASLAKLLRKNLTAEAICDVDRTDLKTIQNPYGSQATATVQAIVGTYNVSTYTTTDDQLSVDYEVIVAEHIYDFEQVLTRFDVFANRVDEQNYSVAYAIDRFVLNTMVKEAGDSYVTPSGSFTTAANLPVIVSNLLSKVAGYAQTYKGLYLVLENTDIPGVIQQEIVSGFNFADSAIRNGLMSSYMGVDVYVVRVGTFANFTSGATFQNQSKRLFGVKGLATYASPRGIRHEEKGVSGKTGKEVVTFGYIGAKVWAVNSQLTIKVVLTANPSPSLSVSPSASPSSSPSPS